MNITPTEIPDVLLIQPRVFEDARGFFFESFNERTLQEKANLNVNWVQDNHSRSCKNVLRGLHYQVQQPQGKLVRVISGEIFDVAVDIRQSSPHFGQWVSAHLTAQNKHQLWVPPGFAHGFLVLSEVAEVLYKTTDYYAPQHERSLLWNDPAIDILWPLDAQPMLSAKDQAGKLLKDAELFA